MDRKYPLESLLISRSHDSTRALELLQQRYAINDKPTLSLRPTEGQRAPKKSNKGLLTTVRESRTRQQKPQKPQHKDQTKRVFKEYIQRSLHYQRTLKHRIHKISKENNNESVDHTQLKEWKHIPHYDQFLGLNKLWTKYIQDLLALTKSNIEKAATQHTLTKLASADYNGCFLNVLKSKNRNCVGKSGIVIWDAKNYFIIVENGKYGGGIKMLEKKGTTFNFVVPLYDIDAEEIDDNDDNYAEFTIIGSRFQYKSADRAGRKFKSKSVDDL